MSDFILQDNALTGNRTRRSTQIYEIKSGSRLLVFLSSRPSSMVMAIEFDSLNEYMEYSPAHNNT